MNTRDTRHWAQLGEAGSPRALRIGLWLAMHGGRAVMRGLLWPISLYFVFANRSPQHALADSLRRLQGSTGLRSFWLRWRIVRHFATTILDRVFLLTGGLSALDIRTSGLHLLDAQLAKGQGAILLGSHLGSFETLRALGRSKPDASIHILMKRQHNSALMDQLAALNPDVEAAIIDADKHPVSVAAEINSAIKAGGLVGILGDRAAEAEPVAEVEFLGGRASVPTSAFTLAAVSRAPIILCFGLYRGGNRYDLIFEAFTPAVSLRRGERGAQVQALAQAYADRLAHYAAQAPSNWFNFHDFWAQPAAPRSLDMAA